MDKGLGFRGESPQVAHILKGVGVVHRDGVAVDSSKVLATMTEAALLAGLHTELLHQSAPCAVG